MIVRVLIMAHDLLVVAVAWLGAFWLRFNLEVVPKKALLPAAQLLPVVLGIFLALALFYQLHRGVWRFTSFPDLKRISKVVISQLIFSGTVLFLINRLEGIPRSVFPLFGILMLLLLAGPRVLLRWLWDEWVPKRKLGHNVLIVGAGAAGESLARSMLREGGHRYFPRAFVDDDPGKLGKEIQGVRVKGDRTRIPKIVADFGVKVIVLAIPRATSGEMHEILKICTTTNVPVRTLPPVSHLISGEASVQELREISIEDLLGREPLSLSSSNVPIRLAGRSVLVTGGGGSIGSELCRQIARLNPTALVILDQSELNVYQVEMELQKKFPALPLYALLGDVCDPERVDYVMRTYRPHIVFHAAAYKHVPLLEEQSREAVHNNIIGTRVMAEAAISHGCEIFTLISTDKAVNPSSVMGATKRVAELFCQNLKNTDRTRFITVRFGNVLDSAGSVVPAFQKQIEEGGPVTVTHPDMTRYFMTIPEACQLILQATVFGKKHEIFVLNMGEPVRIQALAEQMIMVFGKVPGEDIDIVYTGLRPGEKLEEELFYGDELPVEEVADKILRAHHRQVEWGKITHVIDQLVKACDANDELRIKNLLQELVPEYIPQQLPKRSQMRAAGK